MDTRRGFIAKALICSIAATAGIGAAAAGHAASGKKTDTKENLAEAFRAESQANRKYSVYSVMADQEGFPQMARMFRAISESAAVQASTALFSTGRVGNTMQNLQTAIAEEQNEHSVMYPAMMQTAQKEKRDDIAMFFGRASSISQDHMKILSKALQVGGNVGNVAYYICESCGYTLEGRPDSNCPVCSASRQKFFAGS